MAKLPAHLTGLVTDLEQAVAATPTQSGDFQFLKMDKAGNWEYGADGIEVDPKSLFIIDPATFCQGFIAWDDGELVDEKMAVAGEPPILRTDLPDVGASWDIQVGFALLGLEGDDKGEQLLYKASSKGGREAILTVIAEVVERGKRGESDLCPLVKLTSESYKHKKYGKIYKPVLVIEDWLSVEDVPKPKKLEKQEEPEVEDEPEEEAPVRRRRRG